MPFAYYAERSFVEIWGFCVYRINILAQTDSFFKSSSYIEN